MPITRAKASRLLNQKEMALYDDSRINGLRQLDRKGLASRVKRARTARDRARDLVQKHKLASRARSGSKRGANGDANQRSKDKAALMADILKRFEGRLREVEREEKTAATPRRKSTATPAKKAPAKKATARKATARKPTAKPRPKPAAAGTKTAKKATSRKAAPGSTASRRAGRKSTGASATHGTGSGAAASGPRKKSAGKKSARKSRSAGRITPEQALAQTRALLEAKQARDHEPRPWEVPAGGDPVAGTPGYQSDGAARRAKRLHAAEARIPAIQGSISTRDRVNQGKRDRRQGED